MTIISDEPTFREYLAGHDSGLPFPRGPLLIDRFLDTAIKIDVDVLYNGEELFISVTMERIEGADIYSGGSSCVLPPITLSVCGLERITASTETIARNIDVRGLINIQFALLFDTLYVIEANPRVSRTIPFTSRTTGVQFTETATFIQVGATIAPLHEGGPLLTHDTREVHDGGSIVVKVTVLPFKRFRTAGGKIVNAVLGPEMRSTGEVMDTDRDFPTAFAKSQLSASTDVPTSDTIFISTMDTDKRAIVLLAVRMYEMGFSTLTTPGIVSALRYNGIGAQVIRKSSEDRGDGGEPTVVGLINDGSTDMVVDMSQRSAPCNDSHQVRAAVTSQDRPTVTTLRTFNAMVQTIEVCMHGTCSMHSPQEWNSIRLKETRW